MNRGEKLYEYSNNVLSTGKLAHLMRRQIERDSKRLERNSVEPFRLNWVRLTSLISRYQEHVKSRDPPFVPARLFNFLIYHGVIDGFLLVQLSVLLCHCANPNIEKRYIESDYQFLYASNTIVDISLSPLHRRV